ncbi:NADPH-dependent ferric siderophore reductase, contains FAD-binding and SIP domains [Faunimonas pinastri]|uniref:NADPH-dependent ferric siderophore reductase, contains FAD-binding and SIP domains n=1 Tax=Faunimonas pinastri TaxID=1855383 RepID=A0A1H9LJ68_9HYPH|nr:siderophore-interacting protein [Faunimonas pinastri]SER11428.1 NADPH-dependent ferric siderophore reductase, contains FAD-binding and SIP domains [Faunimonas pinastri]
MNRLVARAVVDMADPEPIVAAVCEHFIEHNAGLGRDDDAHVVTFAFGSGRLRTSPGRVELQAEAADVIGLYYMRMTLAGHLKYFARKPEPSVVWTGDGSDLVTPPNFRPVQVAAVRDLTPHMRRITFVGEDLERFADAENFHVSLVIPPEGADLVWPTVGRDGLLHWDENATKPALRRYTVRRCDPVAGEIDVDFVMHEDAGPGSNFAALAKAGQTIGVVGPYGGAIDTEPEWYLLAGDETALPAIARKLELLSPEKRGLVMVEVSGPPEEQRLPDGSGLEIRWVHRGDARPGIMLAEAIRQVEIPEDRTVFAWSATEFGAFKTIRSHFRKERGLKKDQHFAVAYWRLGRSEDETGEEEH